jgi:exosortase E/protease (VPEID-CTERM system)
LLGALLVVELLALSLRFDTKTLVGKYDGWSAVVRELHQVPHIAIAVVVGMLLFGGIKTERDCGPITARGPTPYGTWKWFLFAHLAALAVVFWLTAEVFEGSAGDSGHAWIWFLAWVIAGLTAGLFWLAAILPVRDWWTVLARGAGKVSAGCAVGLAAVGMAAITTDWWRPLGHCTLTAVHAVIGVCFGDAVICDFSRARLSTDRFWVEVSPACSGYEGIGLIWVFLGFFLWHYRTELRFPRAFLLLPLGTALIWLANVGRISVLFILGQWHPDVALAGFHSQAGWLAFNAVALGLLAAAHHSRFFVNGRDDESERSGNPTLAYLAPLFVLLAGTIITHAFTAGYDRWYAARIAATGFVLWVFWRGRADWSWTWSLTPIVIGVAAFAIWLALEPSADKSDAASPWSSAAGLGKLEAVLWIGARVLGSVIVIPLVEELAFRGYLTRRLISADFAHVRPGQFSWFSFLVSSALFGALHTRWIAGTIAGMLFALALYRRGRLSDAVVAHAVANALIAAHVLATGTWSLWA